MLSLSRKDCCCILQQKERECAPVAAVRGSVSGLPVRRSARHQVEWTGTSLADASRCAPCSAADLRCKRLLGRAGTPCGHFSPRRCSSPFTLLRSRKPYSASHPPLRANACARRAAPRTLTASARTVEPSWDLQGPPSSARVRILGDIFFLVEVSLTPTHRKQLFPMSVSTVKCRVSTEGVDFHSFRPAALRALLLSNLPSS